MNWGVPAQVAVAMGEPSPAGSSAQLHVESLGRGDRTAGLTPCYTWGVLLSARGVRLPDVPSAVLL